MRFYRKIQLQVSPKTSEVKNILHSTPLKYLSSRSVEPKGRLLSTYEYFNSNSSEDSDFLKATPRCLKVKAERNYKLPKFENFINIEENKLYTPGKFQISF